MSADPIILLFDSECVLCNGVVRFILKRDRRAVFRFAGLAGDAGQALLKEHSLGAAGIDSFVMLKSGCVYTESSAALRVLGQLGGLWKLAACLLIVPRPLRDAVYRWIARNRYRWFGKRDSCMLPPKDWVDRFLDHG